MKKILSICLSILFVMIFIVQSPISEAAEIEVTETEARKAAIFQILLDMTAVPNPFFDDTNIINTFEGYSTANKPDFIEISASPWKGKVIYLGSAMEVYDKSDSLYSESLQR